MKLSMEMQFGGSDLFCWLCRRQWQQDGPSSLPLTVMRGDFWLYHKVNEQVNLEIIKRFEAEQIEFAFPSQTLYVEKD